MNLNFLPYLPTYLFYLDPVTQKPNPPPNPNPFKDFPKTTDYLKTHSRQFKTTSRLSKSNFRSTSRSLERQLQGPPQGNLNLLGTTWLKSCFELSILKNKFWLEKTSVQKFWFPQNILVKRNNESKRSLQKLREIFFQVNKHDPAIGCEAFILCQDR